MPDPHPDKVELKILNAAIDLFARKGYADATLTDIAQKAKVSKKVLSYHFHTKKALLNSLLEKIWQELADEMIGLSQNETLDPLEKIDKMVDDTIDIFAGDAKLASVFFNEYNPILSGKNDSLNAHFVQYLKAFADIFNKGLKQQFINPMIDGRVFLFFIHGGLSNVIQEWAMHPKIFNLQKIKKNIKYQIKHGIIRW